MNKAGEQLGAIMTGSISSENEHHLISNDFNSLHSLHLATKLREQYRLKQFCDVDITFGEDVLSFHRAVLYSSSGYFRSLMDEDPTRSEYTLEFDPPLERGLVEVLAESFYTGVISIPITNENAVPLLRAGSMVRAEHVTKSCISFMSNELNEENALQIWKSIRFGKFDELKSRATAKIGRHVPFMAADTTFLNLSAEEVIDLLSDDRLSVSKESDVFDAAKWWIKHDQEKREQDIVAVMKTVRFCHIRNEFLTDAVAKDEIVISHPEVYQMFSKALEFKLLSSRGKKDPPIKRRDHVVHGLIAHGEKAYKENQMKLKAAREADPRTLGEKATDSHKSITQWLNKNIVEPLNDQVIYQKYIVKPIVFFRDDIMKKHIIMPIKKAECLPSSRNKGHTRDSNMNETHDPYETNSLQV